ncbi:hypothetical protein AN478_07445 [Thiohalorhabdus denitrificans]|uniref:Membrane-anchored ribosome-binding protein, inhibits growth in stationary phase, ElaB/YqjD/DUF883 family n=1 Tax=Thiohalorhabdus denitrificans TaxID=381306 RepID=A0A0P9C4T6_9GAMM|nr:DUF883 family protein [Thiohalorhabdus denitrificans]KPV40007.1 hypothetical protein AN478_07445 [Thiohalorhabdus denitrificans]SCY11884.1 Membrane-anchored ribosome-binding protein, inhibits growth in stationary phase, ElaB/YqjD/DUF883 family [Thiohalorhabdus denitrificans]
MGEEKNDLNEEIRALKDDLSSLRSDVSELAEAMREAGRDKASDWRSSVQDEWNERREELLHALGVARDRGRQAEEDLERSIGEHPWTSLVAAFGVGYLLAKITGVGGRR